MPNTLDKLRDVQKDLESLHASVSQIIDHIMDAEDGQAATVLSPVSQAVPTPNYDFRSSPASVVATGGLLTNPLTTLITDVTGKTLPSKNKPGQMFTIFEIVTGAAKFGTLNKQVAAFLTKAKIEGEKVTIHWAPRPNGKWINYDIVSVEPA